MDLFAFDDDYVRRLREGDRFTEEHYARYFQVLLAMKLRGRVPPSDVDDIIQEVHRRVFAGLRSESGGCHDGHKFGAYVNSICNNVVSERRRQDRPTEELKDDVTDPIDIPGRLITREVQERVRQILDELSERDAAILRALFLEELEKDEVCRRLGIDRGYLRVLLHRALERFRGKYDDT
ncbi:MAG TPA: sigma-70 family RNA polymerase sigma factor [Thermoanaerobaculia bacterium]|nr:sigma-70 family RNA polymerase sigma factor [Thermoanaerobaculia bacterium]